MSATEGVLAMAAALTHEELLAGRLAVIGSGRQVLDPLDRSLLVAGDGSAGRVLLAGSRADGRDGEPTTGRRSLRLYRREAADPLPAAGERDTERGRVAPEVAELAADATSAGRLPVVPGARDLWDVVDGLEAARVEQPGGGS